MVSVSVSKLKEHIWVRYNALTWRFECSLTWSTIVDYISYTKYLNVYYFRLSEKVKKSVFCKCRFNESLQFPLNAFPCMWYLNFLSHGAVSNRYFKCPWVLKLSSTPWRLLLYDWVHNKSAFITLDSELNLF